MPGGKKRSDEMYAGTRENRIDRDAPLSKQATHDELSEKELEQTSRTSVHASQEKEPPTGTVAGRAATLPVGSLGVEGYATEANDPVSPGAAEDEAQARTGSSSGGE
jgi:hypothetical protein